MSHSLMTQLRCSEPGMHNLRHPRVEPSSKMLAEDATVLNELYAL